MLRENSLARREKEWGAQLTFSPQSFVSEAAASDAPDVAFSAAERLREERDVLFPVAGLDRAKAAKYMKVEGLVGELESAEPGIAREYIDGRLEFVRAEEALEREVLMEDAQALMLYLNEYRSYMLSYTVGRGRVREMVERGSPTEAERWRRYTELMREPVFRLEQK
jgi:transglutaminase-like putative cysteine protease